MDQPTILVVNPNTSQEMTAAIARVAQAAAGPQAHVVTIRSQRGPYAIEGALDTALATAGMLEVVAAYRDLYQVERSFRMAKSDLAARPMFHRIRDSIEAHLTIVFAALAVSREAQARTGVSIKKIIQTLRPMRTATISLGNQQITAPPRIPDHAQGHPRRPC